MKRYIMGIHNDGKTIILKEWSEGPWVRYEKPKTKTFKDAAQQVIEYMLHHKIDMYRVFIDDHQYRIELKRSPIDKPNGTLIDRTKITGECTFE